MLIYFKFHINTLSRHLARLSRHPFKTSLLSRHINALSRHLARLSRRYFKTPYRDAISRHLRLYQDAISRYPVKNLLRYPQSRRTNVSPESNFAFEFQSYRVRCVYAHENLPTEYCLYVNFPRHWCCGTDTFLPT